MRHYQRQATQGISQGLCRLIEQVTINPGLDGQEAEKNSDACGQEEVEFRGLKVGSRYVSLDFASFWKHRIGYSHSKMRHL